MGIAPPHPLRLRDNMPPEEVRRAMSIQCQGRSGLQQGAQGRGHRPCRQSGEKPSTGCPVVEKMAVVPEPAPCRGRPVAVHCATIDRDHRWHGAGRDRRARVRMRRPPLPTNRLLPASIRQRLNSKPCLTVITRPLNVHNGRDFV